MPKRYHPKQCPDCDHNIGGVGCQIEDNGDVIFFKYNTSKECSDFTVKSDNLKKDKK